MMASLRFAGSVVLFCFAVAALAAFSPGAKASDVFLKERRAEQLYDRAVHAFFDQDYELAAELLTTVEDLGSVDPRPYYFLALSHYRSENEKEAKHYFRKAGQLEWRSRGARDYNVSGAIKRIQGRERLYVEFFRKQAKSEWEKAETRRDQVKYREGLQVDQEVLKTLRQRPAPPPALGSGVPFVGTAPFGARSADPFHKKDGDTKDRTISGDAETPVVSSPDDKAEAMPAETPKTDKAADPFADLEEEDDAMPAETPKADKAADPFADLEEEDDAMPAETPKTDKAADPFADLEEDDEAMPAETPKTDKDDSDPFADEEADAMPAETPKTGKDDSDPFADEEDDSDPFGENE